MSLFIKFRIIGKIIRFVAQYTALIGTKNDFSFQFFVAPLGASLFLNLNPRCWSLLKPGKGLI